MRALTTGLTAGLALFHVSPGFAALCVEWQRPARAHAREEVRVALRTLVPLASGEYRPRAFPDYPFRAVLAAPDGTTRPLAMTRSERDPGLWLASFTPSRAGRWSVRIANFEEGGPTEPACYRPLTIRVLAASGR